MQFKHPEILYFLGLLIIPILIHLFQLQRFVKVPFTNVAFLKKISLQTRKSSRLKKWLVLLTRLLAFTALIIAFAQPFFSNSSLGKKQHIFMYLDNSLSTNTKGEKGNLLNIATQDIIENCSKTENYTLMTNDNFHKNINGDELQSILRTLKPTSKRINFEEVFLKMDNQAKTHKNNIAQNILISDFQDIDEELLKNKKVALVQLKPVKKNNIAIDSVFISNKTNQNFKISITLNNVGKAHKNIPISIYNGSNLVSKQSFDIDENKSTIVHFSIQKVQPFLGKLKINIEDSFKFDNTFFFSINTEEKINVMAVGNDNVFLSKIYTKDEYEFTSTSATNMKYDILDKQQLLILNGIKNIPQILSNSIQKFTKKGGDIIIIPNSQANINSYNFLLKNLSVGAINSITKDSLKITKIHFSNPLLKSVFNKKVNNFQYPVVRSYTESTLKNSSPILSFENQKPFASSIRLENSNLIWFASDLNTKNSNFKNSPLIVPVFYNIGQQSLQVSKLFYRLDTKNNIDINTTINKDGVLELKSKKEAFIPIQKSYQNKVTLSTDEQPYNEGFYAVNKEEKTLKTVAFNIPKSESSTKYLNANTIKTNNSIKDTFEKINNTTKVNWLWKWFLILVIVFLLLEILILKYFKI